MVLAFGDSVIEFYKVPCEMLRKAYLGTPKCDTPAGDKLIGTHYWCRAKGSETDGGIAETSVFVPACADMSLK